MAEVHHRFEQLSMQVIMPKLHLADLSKTCLRHALDKSARWSLGISMVKRQDKD